MKTRPSAIAGVCDGPVVSSVVPRVDVGDLPPPDLVAGGGVEGHQEVFLAVGEGSDRLAGRERDSRVAAAERRLPGQPQGQRAVSGRQGAGGDTGGAGAAVGGPAVARQRGRRGRQEGADREREELSRDLEHGSPLMERVDRGAGWRILHRRGVMQPVDWVRTVGRAPPGGGGARIVLHNGAALTRRVRRSRRTRRDP